jgi:NAD(P)H-flavin reductase
MTHLNIANFILTQKLCFQQDPNLRQVFMMKVPGGDWTSSVHEQLQRNTVRPVWVSGPFVSPYNNALNFDNTICVASGIGITPALSIIRAHKESRRINLIWMCRDSASKSTLLCISH